MSKTNEQHEIALRIEGRTIVVRGDGEPRILDLELAQVLGFERPRSIRALIKRHLVGGGLDDKEVCHIVRQTSAKGGRPSKEMWLTEAAALFIAAKADTERGDVVLREIIRVFLAVRRQLASRQAEVAPAAPAPHPAALVGRVDDSPILLRDLRRLIGACSRATAVSERRIRGWMIRVSGASSYLRMSQGQGEMFKEQLMRIALGEDSPPWRLRALPLPQPAAQQVFPPPLSPNN